MILEYDFLNVSSTIIPDITGHGFAGVVRNDGYGGAVMTEELVFGSKRPVLRAKGGEHGGFLQLPEGFFSGTNGMTVSLFACVEASPEPGCLFSFGENACLSVLTWPEEGKIRLWPSFTTAGRSQEACCEDPIYVECGRWFHLSLSISAAVPCELSLELDGRVCAVFSHRRESCEALQGSGLNCFGYGTFAAEPLKGSFTGITIYNEALTGNSQEALFSISDKARFDLEEEALPKFPDQLVRPLALPTHGVAGCTFLWETGCCEMTENRLIPERPAYGSEDRLGCVDLIMIHGGHQRKLHFTFTIPALPPDDELARMDLAALSFAYPDFIAEDLNLPLRGENGSIISWNSSDPEAISFDGKVVRKADTASVILTARARLRTAEESRSFSLNVMAEPLQSVSDADDIQFEGHVLSGRLPEAQKGHAVLNENGSLLSDRQARDIRYLLMLDPDRMLYAFRKTFHVDTKNARPLGGWDEPSGLLRGHSLGHLLSALAYGYAATGDARLKERADFYVKELAALQAMSKGNPAEFVTVCTPDHAPQSEWCNDPTVFGEGYLGAYPPDQFALLEQYTKYATIWAPYYTMHKLLAGLLDVAEYCNNEESLMSAEKLGAWAMIRLKQTTEEQRAQMWGMYIAGEYGGMNEVLARLSRRTGKQEYLKAAHLFDNPKLFNGLLSGEDPLSGMHANQHIPQIIGALACYDAGSDERYYRLAARFYELVINHYTYSIGGVGRGEIFREPDLLAANIEGDRNCETCAAYNMMKLGAALYRHDPENAAYMDLYERTMLNQIAASQRSRETANAHHAVTYMLPISPGAVRSFSSDYEDFTCCHGTGMENHVRYSEHIFLRTDDTLYVSLYAGSRFFEQDGNALCRLEAVFPANKAQLVFERETEITVKLRIPEWCASFQVHILGTKIHTKGVTEVNDRLKAHYKGRFVVISGHFIPEDRIEILMPFTLHLCRTKDRLDGLTAASVMYGPYIMTALSSQNTYLTLPLPEDLTKAFTVDESGNIPVLTYEGIRFVPMASQEPEEKPYHTYIRIVR